MSNIITVILVLIVVLGGGYLLLNYNNPADYTNNAPTFEDLSKTENENSNKSVSVSLNYLDYSESFLTRANEGKVVLFFKANWCPTCNALDKDILKNLNKIPEDVTILKVDYDVASDLKKKYEVVTQHTLVQVDAKGNEITKWVGGNTLGTILERVI